jgi:hypothetical protein
VTVVDTLVRHGGSLSLPSVTVAPRATSSSPASPGF